MRSEITVILVCLGLAVGLRGLLLLLSDCRGICGSKAGRGGENRGVRTGKGTKKKNGGGTAGGGIGFCGVLTIVFIVLKLLGKISWSWVWVLSPLWISFIIGCILFLVMLIAAVIDTFKN